MTSSRPWRSYRKSFAKRIFQQKQPPSYRKRCRLNWGEELAFIIRGRASPGSDGSAVPKHLPVLTISITVRDSSSEIRDRLALGESSVTDYLHWGACDRDASDAADERPQTRVSTTTTRFFWVDERVSDRPVTMVAGNGDERVVIGHFTTFFSVRFPPRAPFLS